MTFIIGLEVAALVAAGVVTLCCCKPTRISAEVSEFEDSVESLQDNMAAVMTSDEPLTRAQIDAATVFRCDFTSGSLPPQYAWEATITVTPDNVSLTVSHDGKRTYHRKSRQTASQFAEFRDNLYNLGLRYGEDREAQGLCGDGSYYVSITKKDSVIFGGQLYYQIITTRGDLTTPFESALPSAMRQVCNDPSSTF